MADKKINEVTKVTDMAYVPVILADGSVGQIAKADLASVVADNMKYIYCNSISIEAGKEAVVSGYSGAVLLFDHTSMGGICGLVLYSYGSIEVVGLKIEANTSGTSPILVYYETNRGLVIKNNTTTDFSRLACFQFTTTFMSV